MIKRKNGFSINLNYLDMLLEKWKLKKRLTLQEKDDLKYILKMSEICKKCGELDNIITENKMEYCQTYEIQYWCKFLICSSIFMSIFSFSFGFTLTVIFTLLLIYIKKASTIVKCINCNSINSFVKIKKYLSK